MGKKSRRSRPSKKGVCGDAGAASGTGGSGSGSGSSVDKNRPTWHEASSLARPGTVLALPASADTWHVMKLGGNGLREALGIFDVSHKLRGRSGMGLVLGLGPPLGSAEEVRMAIWSCMIKPADGSDPRRPHLLLVEPDLASFYKRLRQEMEAVGVFVRLNTEDDLARFHEEHGGDASLGTTRSKNCTWHRGDSTKSTVQGVCLIPKEAEETWNVAVFDADGDPDVDGGFLLAITMADRDERTFPPIGIGPCVPPTANSQDMVNGILSTMLRPNPDLAVASGNPLVSLPRRPGRIALDRSLERHLEDVRNGLDGTDVEVTLVCE